MGKYNITRGEKWARVKKKYEFEGRTKDIEWLDSQKSIVEDIKEYEDSLKPVKEDKPTKSKKEK